MTIPLFLYFLLLVVGWLLGRLVRKIIDYQINKQLVKQLEIVVPSFVTLEIEKQMQQHIPSLIYSAFHNEIRKPLRSSIKADWLKQLNLPDRIRSLVSVELERQLYQPLENLEQQHQPVGHPTDSLDLL